MPPHSTKAAQATTSTVRVSAAKSPERLVIAGNIPRRVPANTYRPVYSPSVVPGGTLVTHGIESIDELRARYLDFFAQRGHLIYPSASLKSEDPSLMYTSAGMVQFKPYFLGATPKFAGYDGTWPRVTTAQKCLRINDIENVGRTLRHHSFFEMLGNFSFGDYFKSDAAAW